MRDYVKRAIHMLPKLSQEQTEKLFSELAGENEMMDSILESLSTGLIVVDKKWQLIRKNKLSERYLSMQFLKEDSGNDNLKLWEIVSEKEIADFLKDAAEKDRTNISEEFTTEDSSGAVRFLTVSVFSLIHDGEMKGSIVKIYDITEKRKTEIRLRRMENMAGLTNLAAGMAHEIKNPLGAISIHIQLIQKAIKKQRETEGHLPEKKFLEDHLDVVNEEIENLNKLVMDFLFAVRPVNASLTLTDPSKILSSLVDFFGPEFNKSKVNFRLELPEESKRLLIDEKLFRECMINLIQNSFAAIREKFSECAEPSEEEINDESQMKGLILIQTSVKDDKYLIQLSDNGSGMSEETLSRIFEPYYTTKANGTGLGMTMVYKIIKEFQGEIQVESEKGSGSTFRIVIPVPQTDTKLIK